MFDVDQNLSNNNDKFFKSDKNQPHGIKKGVKGRLPKEVLDFVKNESYSLLVKGKPGTGKTTFALTLMDNLDEGSNYFYISTRLSLKQLSFYYPWITKFYSFEDKNYGYRFEDARLDEPESLFERITNQLMDVKSPVIIIDTWDTIASFMDRESRLNNERVLQIWRERAGAKLIFLSETIDLGIIDSIVDGVVTMTNKYTKSNFYREIMMNKLRGVPITCFKYYYSLLDGVFHTYDTLNDLDLFYKFKNERGNIFKNIPVMRNKVNNFLKLKRNAYNYLDDFYNNPKIVTLLIDSNINNELILSILLMHFCYWLRLNNTIMINNFDSHFTELCTKMLSYYVDGKVVDNNIIDQQIDFTKIHRGEKITIDNLFNENENNFSLFKTLISNQNKDKMNSHSKSSNLVKEGTKILNLLNGKNITSLLSEDNFLTLLEQGFSKNIILMRDPDTSTILSERTRYYKMFLKSKNIFVETMNKDVSLYGMVYEKDKSFVRWYPLL